MSSTHIHKQQSLDIVKIHMSTPNLHCTIYDSHMPRTKKLLSDTIHLLCKLINMNNLLYTLPKIWINMTCITFFKKNSSSIVEQNRAEPKFIRVSWRKFKKNSQCKQLNIHSIRQNFQPHRPVRRILKHWRQFWILVLNRKIN
jgi:hypothetical protein